MKYNMDFIENGLAHYYKTGKREYINNSINSKGYRLVIKRIDSHMITSTKRNIYKLVRILARGIYIWTDLWCIYQQEYNNSVYEYWMYKEWIEGRDYRYKRCKFIITQASSKDAYRKILYESVNFFNEYRVDERFTIVVPEHEFNVVYSSQGFVTYPKYSSR